MLSNFRSWPSVTTTVNFALCRIRHIKEHEAKSSRVAHFDALTGIANRVLLDKHIKQAIAQTTSDKNMMAVCYLDLIAHGKIPAYPAFDFKYDN